MANNYDRFLSVREGGELWDTLLFRPNSHIKIAFSENFKDWNCFTSRNLPFDNIRLIIFHQNVQIISIGAKNLFCDLKKVGNCGTDRRSIKKWKLLMENVYLWMKTKEQFIINKKNWKMAMKINPIRSERRCKCSGSVRRILSAHLGHRLCNGRCFGGSPSSAYFFCKLCRNRCRSPCQCRLETAFSSAVSSICHDCPMIPHTLTFAQWPRIMNTM